MTRPLQPLPDHDPLKAGEVAAAYGCGIGAVEQWARRGRFPGAFRTLGIRQQGRWRIPREDAVAVGRELGVIEGD